MARLRAAVQQQLQGLASEQGLSTPQVIMDPGYQSRHGAPCLFAIFFRGVFLITEFGFIWLVVSTYPSEK